MFVRIFDRGCSVKDIACFLLFAFYFIPLNSSAQDKSSINFPDIWHAFNIKATGIDSFMLSKGYKLISRVPLSHTYKQQQTGHAASISFTYYDSSRISGIELETDNELAVANTKTLLAEGFVQVNGSTSINENDFLTTGVLQLESVKYMLFCSIMHAFPDAKSCKFSFAWHDLITRSMVVVKKENNVHLTQALLDEYQSMTLDNTAKEESMFQPVMENPSFRGGNRGLYIYLNKEVRYPEAAVKDSTEGLVYVDFTIDEKGNVKDPVIVKGKEAGHGLPEEALRLVRSMPLWKPGKQMGKVSRSSVTLKILFKIRLNNLL